MGNETSADLPRDSLSPAFHKSVSWDTQGHIPLKRILHHSGLFLSQEQIRFSFKRGDIQRRRQRKLVVSSRHHPFSTKYNHLFSKKIHSARNIVYNPSDFATFLPDYQAWLYSSTYKTKVQELELNNFLEASTSKFEVHKMYKLVKKFVNLQALNISLKSTSEPGDGEVLLQSISESIKNMTYLRKIKICLSLHSSKHSIIHLTKALKKLSRLTELHFEMQYISPSGFSALLETASGLVNIKRLTINVKTFALKPSDGLNIMNFPQCWKNLQGLEKLEFMISNLFPESLSFENTFSYLSNLKTLVLHINCFNKSFPDLWVGLGEELRKLEQLNRLEIYFEKDLRIDTDISIKNFFRSLTGLHLNELKLSILAYINETTGSFLEDLGEMIRASKLSNLSLTLILNEYVVIENLIRFKDRIKRLETPLKSFNFKHSNQLLQTDFLPEIIQELGRFKDLEELTLELPLIDFQSSNSALIKNIPQWSQMKKIDIILLPMSLSRIPASFFEALERIKTLESLTFHSLSREVSSEEVKNLALCISNLLRLKNLELKLPEEIPNLHLLAKSIGFLKALESLQIDLEWSQKLTQNPYEKFMHMLAKSLSSIKNLVTFSLRLHSISESEISFVIEICDCLSKMKKLANLDVLFSGFYLMRSTKRPEQAISKMLASLPNLRNVTLPILRSNLTFDF